MRALLPDDAARLRAHLERLDAETRRLRFTAGLSDEALSAYVRDIDWTRSLHIAHLDAGRCADEVRAVASLAWSDPFWPQAAELGVSVEPDWQGRGIGSALIDRVLVAARNRGIVEVRMACLPGNVRMRHIARKFGSRLTLVDGDVEGLARLAAPDLSSLWREIASLAEAVVDAWLPAATDPYRAWWAGPNSRSSGRP